MRKVKLIIEYIFTQEKDESYEEFDNMIVDFMAGSHMAENRVYISEGFVNATKEELK